MENSKLFQLLSSLTSDEFRSFGEFVKSEYFNKSRDINKLLEFIRSYYPEFEKINKENIFIYLYPGEKYKDKKLRDLFSKMLSLAEKFLAYEDLKNYPMEEKKHLMNQFTIRNLDKHFKSLEREMSVLLGKIKVKDSNYFYSSFQLKKDTRSYYEQKKTLGKRGAFFEEMNSEIESFMLFFVYNMLKYYIELLNQSKLYKHEPKFEYVEHVAQYLNSKKIYNEPQINMLYNCLLMLTSEKENPYYSNLKSLLLEYGNALNKDDLKSVYIQIYNYTRERYATGKTELNNELFEIIKQMVELGVYPMEQGYITSHTYINFISVALQVNDFHWAHNFMENYRHNISPSEENSTYKYCSSLYNYKIGNTGKALELLSEVKIKDFYDYIRVKNQTSRIFFETGEYESLISLLDSFKHYFDSNSKIPDYIRQRFEDYANFLKKVINAKIKGDDFRLMKIRKEIEKAPVFENKSWLLEKIK